MTADVTTNDVQAYEDSLRRAFVASRADYVLIDGWSGEFLRRAAQHGLDQGWLSHCVVTSRAESDDQYTALAYRLTPSGNKHFGL